MVTTDQKPAEAEASKIVTVKKAAPKKAAKKPTVKKPL